MGRCSVYVVEIMKRIASLNKDLLYHVHPLVRLLFCECRRLCDFEGGLHVPTQLGNGTGFDVGQSINQDAACETATEMA